MKTDVSLLREFAQSRDDRCFTELVQRHIGFVYGVCLRRLRDPHAAQDATQAVFIALARKAETVSSAASVIGWLHRSACFETRNLMRAHHNRLARETEAQRLGTTTTEARPDPERLEAVLDDALGELPARDRDALLARYFAGKSYAELGASLQLTENAARMRVERALLRLRDRLARRGVTSTAAALTLALPGYAAAAVPVGLAGAVSQAAVAGAIGTTGVAAVFAAMSTTKVITGAAIAVVVGGAYIHHRTSELVDEVATLRAERAATEQRWDAMQQQIDALSRQQASATSGRSATGAASSSANGADQVPAAAAAAPVPGVTPKAPKGWYKNGSAPELYEVGVDANTTWGGMASAYAKSVGEAKGKFGGMMQTIAAGAYHNQRVKMTGWIKTQDVEHGAQLWLRVDGAPGTQPLQFDNMHGRAPKGTTDWEEYSIVLDVPPEARQLAYGFFVAGKGQMWVNGLTITPVGSDVPNTHMLSERQLPSTPVNLGFAPPQG